LRSLLGICRGKETPGIWYRAVSGGFEGRRKSSWVLDIGLLPQEPSGLLSSFIRSGLTRAVVCDGRISQSRFLLLGGCWPGSGQVGINQCLAVLMTPIQVSLPTVASAAGEWLKGMPTTRPTV